MKYEINLARTLDCGQAFRWSLGDDGFWTGASGVSSLSVSQNDLSPITGSAFWRHYFDMDFDYSGAISELSKVSPVMSRACAFSSGIQILNQDPWEALCSFVISQNNNIKRIKLIISRLCRLTTLFPTPQQIVDIGVAGLRELGLGFRDSYVHDAAGKVLSGEICLEEISRMDVPRAMEKLKTIKGVGDKVASCALLYGFHRLECFPMDVWMKRVMSDMFDGRSGQELFGPLAGLAQQYLFFYARECYYKGRELQ